ncbi:hypothetical protein FRACYDRAFT_237002 [Fragilariopsis cylindrus CCMP1102]|uniref:Uncharacterized protein n=1 Tax=Fragilariopsis cylindrus CCMP1102 TaxID=635003 RepID=A0A1E7FLN4_9STRA|nr:hypothetical protein FRACYDRAFT_237002 [Fragilariopsis cylindrus CCMP1102]|eukprot:OEU18723.1 hypothetical protein FRACYDRAFT_237002 [Fragilariopsis cylindrus CCMP1102]
MRFFQKRSVVDIGENKSGSKWHAPYASQRKYPLSDYNITMNDNNDNDDEQQQQQQHESIEMEYSKNRQSLSELQQQQQHQQKWDPSSSQISIGGFGGSSSNNITRPVLITVKDGGYVDEPSSDAATAPLLDHTNTMPVLELTSRFIVDDLHQQQQQQQQQKSSLSVNVSNKTDNNRNSSSSKPFRKVGMSARKRDSKNESSFVTPNKLEIARKERWRRGIEVEMEKRLTKEKGNTNKTRSTSRSRSTVAGEGGGATNGGDKDDNSSIYADSNTQGSQTTGNTTDFSSIGDSIWTDATDETGMGRCRRGHCSSNQHVAESVAEDFGTFAKLLLNDGYACFETAADITRETVGGMKIRSQRS